MSCRSFLPFARRHCAWLLWLALLLPLAQLAGTAHAISHVPDTVQPAEPGDQGTLALHHCPLCPLANVVGDGALPSAPGTVAQLALAAAAPVLPDSVAPLTPPPRFFRSRAPPSA